MKLHFQEISHNWLKRTLEWVVNDYLNYFIQHISNIFSFKANNLQDLQIILENEVFSPTKRHIIAITQKLNEKRFSINLNELKIQKITRVSEMLIPL